MLCMFAPKAETAAAKEPQAGSSLVANWRIPVEDADCGAFFLSNRGL